MENMLRRQTSFMGPEPSQETPELSWLHQPTAWDDALGSLWDVLRPVVTGQVSLSGVHVQNLSVATRTPLVREE